MYTESVRTTIDIKPEHRARLLELAARRGEKGFSSVVGEALESYLHGLAEKQDLRRRALRLLGTLPAKEAERLRSETSKIREFWR
jgi:hypothetical protein